MEMDTSLSSSDIFHPHSSTSDPEDKPIETISRQFSQLHLKTDNDDDDDDDDDSTSKLLSDPVVRADDEDNEAKEENDDDDDFTFMLVGGDDSPIDGEKVLEDGQIRPMFPLFDQKLLLDDGEYEVEEIDHRLPIQPPVDKIFIQPPRGLISEDATTGPYCEWSKESATATAELTKKSNSTGFSKLWRLKDKGGRSNSYGRDAFVFFKSSDKKTSTATGASSSSSKAVASDGTFVKVNVAGGKARVVTKGKKSTVASAHEAYLKSKGEHTEEERRRSYLPYRPELMGFFTNVHGGLTKNVHPY